MISFQSELLSRHGARQLNKQTLLASLKIAPLKVHGHSYSFQLQNLKW